MKAREVSEYINLEIFKCKHCGKLLGSTAPNVLHLATATFRRTVTFECAFCEKTILWRPSDEKFNNNK